MATIDGKEQRSVLLNVGDAMDLMGGNVELLEFKSGQARLGFNMPPNVHIAREELVGKPFNRPERSSSARQ